MTHSEVRFVAESVRDALTAREYLRASTTKSSGDPAPTIAEAIHAARETYRTSDKTRRGVAMTEGLALIKKSIHEIIPDTFGWWLEADNDVRISVRWLWLGHSAVTHSGSVSDCDVTILLELLRYVDWAEEAKEAMRSVEEAEAALLKNAQERRRLRLTSNAHTLAAPPPLETIEPAPVTFEQKRLDLGPRKRPGKRITAEEMMRRMAEAERPERKQAERERAQIEREEQRAAELEAAAEERRRRYAERQEAEATGATEPETDAPEAEESTPEPEDAAPPSPPSPAQTQPATATEQAESAPSNIEHIGRLGNYPRRGHHGFFLTRAPYDGALIGMTWEEFDSLSEILRAVRANPPGTYTAAHLYGNHHMKGAEQVWKSFGDGRPYPNQYRGQKKLRGLTPREFNRLANETERPKNPQRFSFGW